MFLHRRQQIFITTGIDSVNDGVFLHPAPKQASIAWLSVSAQWGNRLGTTDQIATSAPAAAAVVARCNCELFNLTVISKSFEPSSKNMKQNENPSVNRCSSLDNCRYVLKHKSTAQKPLLPLGLLSLFTCSIQNHCHQICFSTLLTPRITKEGPTTGRSFIFI